MGRVKHGIDFWIRTGKVNPSIRGHRKLQQYLEKIEAELIEDQGGPGELTAAKEILIKSVIEAYGVILLASMYCSKEGILRPDKAKEGIVELQPVMGSQLLAFMNTIRQNLLALGLDRRDAEKVLNLGAYLEAKGKEKDKQGKENG